VIDLNNDVKRGDIRGRVGERGIRKSANEVDQLSN